MAKRFGRNQRRALLSRIEFLERQARMGLLQPPEGTVDAHQFGILKDVEIRIAAEAGLVELDMAVLLLKPDGALFECWRDRKPFAYNGMVFTIADMQAERTGVVGTPRFSIRARGYSKGKVISYGLPG